MAECVSSTDDGVFCVKIGKGVDDEAVTFADTCPDNNVVIAGIDTGEFVDAEVISSGCLDVNSVVDSSSCVIVLLGKAYIVVAGVGVNVENV